jgi:hypothetical protein
MSTQVSDYQSGQTSSGDVLADNLIRALMGRAA